MSSISYARSSLSLSHLRQVIGDDPPPILASGCFKWKLFQGFHLSISLKSVSNGGSMWGCNCQRPIPPDAQPGVLHVKGSSKEDVNTELISKPPFVSIALASAAMRHGGTDTWTINETEEKRKEACRHFVIPMSENAQSGSGGRG